MSKHWPLIPCHAAPVEVETAIQHLLASTIQAITVG